MLEELSVGRGKYRFSSSGIAFETSIRKIRGSLFHTIPKELCLGCELKKGQKLLNHIVYYEDDKIGIFIQLK